MTESELIELRKQIKLFSIGELCVMFNCGRGSIDDAINSGQLEYLSPNNRDRYIYLDKFLEYMQKRTKE